MLGRSSDGAKSLVGIIGIDDKLSLVGSLQGFRLYRTYINHMAQGAATSMEDGAFLGRTIRAVVQGRISMKEAIGIYERTCMPLEHVKQQISFLNGAIWQLSDGPQQE